MKTDVIINREALYALRELPSESVNCCVTSPPYYGLRDYGLDAQIGREDTPEQYIDRLVDVFRELRRVLKDDGTFWLNIADTYCGSGMKAGCKQKDLIGIPWLLAFALRSDGWYLRSDIIWLKENPMPESCRDRPSRCYEHIFLLTKSKKYYYAAAAVCVCDIQPKCPVVFEYPAQLPEHFHKPPDILLRRVLTSNLRVKPVVP